MTVGQNAGAYRTDASFCASFILLPGQTASINLHYYCRYWELLNGSLLNGLIHIGFSRAAALAPQAGQAAFTRMAPGSPPRHRDFIRDDEGPPVIWVHAPATNTFEQLVEFEYAPSAKRAGNDPTPSRAPAGRQGDFPTADTSGLHIVPGI